MLSLSNLVPILWFNDAPLAYQLCFQDPATTTMEGIYLFNLHLLFVIISVVIVVGWLLFSTLYEGTWGFSADAQPGGNNPPAAPVNNPPTAPGGGGAVVNPGNAAGAGAQGAGGASVGTDRTDTESDNESDDTTAYPASSQESHYPESSQESSASS